MNRATQSGNTGKKQQPETESERIAEVMHEAIDRFTQRATEAEQRIKHAANDAQASMKAKRENIQATAERTENALETYVEEHPWRSLGIAFGIGIAVTSLLRR